MEIQLSEKDTGLRYTTYTEWNDDEGEEGYFTGTVEVTISKDFHYMHPSGDCEVVLRKGASLDLFIAKEMNPTFSEPWWWTDGLSTRNGEGWTVDECLAWNNCSLAVGEDEDESLHTLIRRTINILLMHAVNYDGNDGRIYDFEGAQEHYGYFGIEYLRHATDREEVYA